MRTGLRKGWILLATCGALATAACRDASAPSTSMLEISDAPGATQWSNISAGTFNNCATDADGRSYCWGFDTPEMCNNQSCAFNIAPRAVNEALRFAVVETSGQMVCGLTLSGEIYCWGSALSASLGDGVTTKSAVPVKVLIPGVVAKISTGYSRACALNTLGAMYCWGEGGAALGAGPGIGIARVPLLVQSKVAFTEISAGNTQTCAIDVSSDAYCWGGGYGSLGIGDRDTSCAVNPSCGQFNTPQLIDGGLKWAHISAGNAFTCGVTRDALGYCWGDVPNVGDQTGSLGKLGSGEVRGSKVPVAVVGGHRFQTIRAGTRQACGVTNDGAAYCWGLNSSGEIGNGRTDLFVYNPGGKGRYPTPQAVAGNLRFESIAAAENSCGVTVAHNLFCWGTNAAGLLGAGNVGLYYANVPTRVAAPVK